MYEIISVQRRPIACSFTNIKFEIKKDMGKYFVNDLWLLAVYIQ